jgi:hypothetical protein
MKITFELDDRVANSMIETIILMAQEQAGASISERTAKRYLAACMETYFGVGDYFACRPEEVVGCDYVPL